MGLSTTGGGSAAINSTDNRLPKRQSATAFADSLLSDDGTDARLISGLFQFHGATSGHPAFQRFNNSLVFTRADGSARTSFFAAFADYDSTSAQAISFSGNGGGVSMGSAGQVSWNPLATGGADGGNDSGLKRFGVALVGPTNGSTGGGAFQLIELSGDPDAPAANNVILFAKDNGSGKTGLYARFPTGAVQQVALEP